MDEVKLDLESRFHELNYSLPSIEVVSGYCLFHQHQAQRITEKWLEYLFQSDVSSSKAIALIYVMNEVIRREFKDKGGKATRPYSSAVGPLVSRAADAIENRKNPKVTTAFSKCLKIWNDNNLLEHKYLEDALAKFPPASQTKSDSSNDNKKKRKGSHDSDGASNNNNENNGVHEKRGHKTSSSNKKEGRAGDAHHGNSTSDDGHQWKKEKEKMLLRFRDDSAKVQAKLGRIVETSPPESYREWFQTEIATLVQATESGTITDAMVDTHIRKVQERIDYMDKETNNRQELLSHIDGAKALILSQIHAANQIKQDIFNSGNAVDSLRPSKRQKMAEENFEQEGGAGAGAGAGVEVGAGVAVAGGGEVEVGEEGGEHVNVEAAGAAN